MRALRRTPGRVIEWETAAGSSRWQEAEHRTETEAEPHSSVARHSPRSARSGQSGSWSLFGGHSKAPTLHSSPCGLTSQWCSSWHERGQVLFIHTGLAAHSPSVDQYLVSVTVSVRARAMLRVGVRLEVGVGVGVRVI